MVIPLIIISQTRLPIAHDQREGTHGSREKGTARVPTTVRVTTVRETGMTAMKGALPSRLSLPRFGQLYLTPNKI